MRKTLIALAFASALPAVALAMPGAGHDHHGGKRAPHMFEQLDLSKEQKRDMRKLMGEQMKSRHDITQRYLDKLPEAERKAMQDELKNSKQETHKKIRDLLKPEQQKQFDEMHEKMEAKRAERAEFKQWKAERDSKN
ncbi:Spy/CpxP family protein refolding chaperone [Stutzerimonas sp. NM35]|uniref:Spy/CpxP family protein refolding chaperone n=1 Tax=Stutzerimonas stutzeri TaxID=316 RepID=UPI0015E33CB3|nr:Spy/CpxP family protein refolding chaperone [Stutzerimonas stutzeri]MBA1263432.1 periplasmic heavy metal sensor [Stutzerimonas stutzeri]